MMMIFETLFLSTNTYYTGAKRREGHWICYWLEIKKVYTSKPNPLYTAFLHSIKLLAYRIRLQFVNILSPNVASKQESNIFQTNPVLLEICDQFLRKEMHSGVSQSLFPMKKTFNSFLSSRNIQMSDVVSKSSLF